MSESVTMTRLRQLSDRFFAPEWAGGWAVMRYMWAFAALLGHGKRITGIPGPYASDDMVFTMGYYRLADFVVFTPTTATLIWVGGVIGIGMVAWGGRAFRLGLLLWFVCAWALLTQEALNIKAWDRLTLWLGLCLFISPAGERDLDKKKRSPVGRYAVLIVMAAIYGSTGWMKLMEAGSVWRDGTVMQYHLVHQWHAGGHLAAWVSGQRWITAPMCWVTILFECGFPFLIWFRRYNPWLLGLGLVFHVGLVGLMQVGPFAFVSWSAYAVMLDPELARKGWAALKDRQTR